MNKGRKKEKKKKNQINKKKKGGGGAKRQGERMRTGQLLASRAANSSSRPRGTIE